MRCTLLLCCALTVPGPALDFLGAKRGRFTLVVGVEKMTATPGARIGEILLSASHLKTEGEVPAGFAGIFGRIAESYFQRHGDQSDALAAIAAKNHANGVDNPYAQMRKDLGYAFCRAESEKNPFVAPPLKRTDCSLVSDGAAALVIASGEAAAGFTRAVRFRATAQVNDFLPMASRDIIKFEGAAQAWRQALATAQLGLDDLSLVETHDCFTIAELIEYEAMGLVPEGQGARAVLEGWTAKDGRLPVNRSGGLKAKGHPIGATGVSMHVLTAMQLTGEAGDMQLSRADRAGVFNMGGAAVAEVVEGAGERAGEEERDFAAAAAAAAEAGDGAELPPPRAQLQRALDEMVERAISKWREAEGSYDDIGIVLAEIGTA